LEEARPDWVITLGNEPLRALGLRRLSADTYGVPVAARLLGRRVRLLRLVHTRQQARHGASSSTWAQLHQVWVAGSGAATVRQAISASL
jgi:hypothetical protein